jgi:hypothetical protein
MQSKGGKATYEWPGLMICIRKVHGSYLGRRDTLSEVYRGLIPVYPHKCCDTIINLTTIASVYLLPNFYLTNHLVI